jgi:hypothetical protein
MDATPLATEMSYVLFTMASVMIFWVVVAAWSSVIFIRCVRRHSLKQNVIPIFLLLASIFVACNFFSYMRGCNYLGGVLRFAATRSYYDRQIAQLPANGKPRLLVFSWGGMIWASRGVVYDESDEIALPIGQQSAAWKANPNRDELSCGNWGVHRLWAHYYLVDFLC